jgi:hypothetical protein
MNDSTGKEKSMKKWMLPACLCLLLVAAGSAIAQQVVMNEIYSRGVAGNLDWIELYNPGATQVSLAGYKIYDIGGSGGTKPKKQFPASAVIPAKGFYVIITDTADYTGDLSGFGLSSAGEKAWLEDSLGTVIDTVTFAAMTTTQTYGRGPDGGAWTLLSAITRGATNGKILTNEIYSRGVAGNLDWIEIYNGVSAPVNITGYKIYDTGGNTGSKPKKRFPDGTIVPAGGFFVIITDTADYTGDLSAFGLSSSGEMVWLEDTLGAIIDTVTFGAMSTTQSWSRIPDGGAWQLANTITRGASNGGGVGVEDGDVTAPERFVLAQNYPNPFNPSTTIRYGLPQRSAVTLGVYNLIGQEVARLVQGEQEAGYHEVKFDGSNLSSGVYLYRLTAGSTVQTRKLMLVK